MAESTSGNNSSIVAIFAIVVIALLAGLIAWKAGVFGGGSNKKQLDINVNTGAVSGVVTSPALN
jgi:ABC-type transporter Mla subunit MlaD